MKSKTAKKSLKTLLVILTLSAVLALPASAATPAAPQKGLIDAARIFETHAAVPLQAAELSQKEMVETEGAVAPFAVWAAWTLGSAAVSAWLHHGIHYLRHGRLGTAKGAALAATKGAIAGGLGNGIAAAGRLSGPAAYYMRFQTTKLNAAMNAPSTINYLQRGRIEVSTH